jgi:hypothetical protein
MPSGCARIPTSSISITIFRPVLSENAIWGGTHSPNVRRHRGIREQ